MDKVRAHIFIYGTVQGVFFRRTAKNQAETLGIVGWIRNRADGSVDACAQGEKKQVDKFIAWCKKGSPLSKVESIEVEWKKNLEDFDEFSVV